MKTFYKDIDELCLQFKNQFMTEEPLEKGKEPEVYNSKKILQLMDENL